MMNTTVVGKLYGGKAYDWTDRKNDNEERSLFRGRIGYRNPETGEFEFMDAVCFKDFGAKGGLVAFLDDHFSADGKDGKTGHPVVLTGYVRKTKKTMEVELKAKKSGTTKTIPNVPYDTFEFVIQSASFVPSAEGRNTGRSVDTEEDFDDIDDEDEFEVVDGDDENDGDDIENDDADFEEVEETEEVEEKPKKQTQRGGRSTQQQKKKQQSAGRKAQNQAKKEVASSKQKEEDSEFFDA